MTNRVVRSITTLALFTLIISCGSDDPPTDLRSTAAIYSPIGAELRAHMAILAADDMQGREAGTPGHQAAAEYVAKQFAELGLKPLGDDRTYFQYIDFLQARIVAGTGSMVLHKDAEDAVLNFGPDFVRSGGYGEPKETVSGPLIFVGFGIQAPEYDHDDFAGVDVSDKILVMLSGAPPHFAPDERAFYSSGTNKQSLAVALGAFGIVTIRTPVDQERLPWSIIQASAAGAGMRWLDASGAPRDGFPSLTGDAILSEAGARRMFELANRDLDAIFERHSNGEAGSFALGVSATLERHSSHRQVSSPNVLALLPGSDSELRDEYVLFTAHLDHLGIRADADGTHQIHNGAYDNAAGVATILRVAAAMRNLDPAPRRSVIFAAFTAEEKGLRGSDYLAHHPPVVIDKIVANINIDMPYLGYPITDVEGFGVEHSTLHDALLRATAELGLELTPDPRPELVRLIRSDQFSFVKQDVPGLNLKSGSRSADSSIDGNALRATFLREHYHRPSDNLTLPFSETGAELFAQVAFTLGVVVSNDDERPEWKEGDFFGLRYAKARPE